MPSQLDALEHLGQTLALETPTARKRMLVIVNPYATTVSQRMRSLVVYALQGRYDVEAIDTKHRDHATELCREAALEGYDVVVAFGGDGTVNEAANGLAGSQTALTCLPGGATNVFCRMVGIPHDIVDATEHLLRVADRWAPQRLDLARVRHRLPDGQWLQRHFTFSSGLGLDAAVVRRVDAHPRVKAALRHWSFAAIGLGVVARQYSAHPPRIDVQAGEQCVRGVTAFVQNGDPYTYWSSRPLRVADDGALDDGLLAGAVLRRATPLDVPTVLARLFSHRLRVTRHRQVDGFAGVRSVRCVSADGRSVPLQVDGDHINDVVEAVYDVAPGALSVVA